MNSPVYAIRSRRVVTPEGVREAAVVIKDGKIVEVTNYSKLQVSCRVEDVGDAVVMPGGIDVHVHMNEPGRTDWEGIETATQAGAAGGTTTIIDMPLNSTPVTTTVKALEEKLAAAKNKMWVDCGFLAGLVPGNEKEIEPLIRAGVLGVKAFLVHSGIDDFPNATEKELSAALPVLAKYGLPLMAHAEIDYMHKAPANSDPRSYQGYLASRPRAWEQDAIEMMIALCRKHKARVHIVHLSDADALPILKKARAEGLPLTVESCPHYLYFTAENIPDGDTRFKCAPPIRERENQEKLWQGFKEGAIDLIGSDHSPCPPSMKRLSEGDFKKAWGGISSLQLTLPITWTGARAHGFSVSDVARWLSAAPAKFMGLSDRKGAIARGFDADLVVWQPEVSFEVATAKLYHRHKVTPYEGERLYGVVERVYLAGSKISENGVVLADARGKIVLRNNK